MSGRPASEGIQRLIQGEPGLNTSPRETSFRQGWVAPEIVPKAQKCENHFLLEGQLWIWGPYSRKNCHPASHSVSSARFLEVKATFSPEEGGGSAPLTRPWTPRTKVRRPENAWIRPAEAAAADESHSQQSSAVFERESLYVFRGWVGQGWIQACG